MQEQKHECLSNSCSKEKERLTATRLLLEAFGEIAPLEGRHRRLNLKFKSLSVKLQNEFVLKEFNFSGAHV